MKTYIRRREKNTHLIVFFGGWGADENMFTPLCNDDFDFIMFYNYSADEALVLPETKTYKQITLIGWSLGVWAAEYFASKTKIIPDISIAVNGTPLPSNNQYGIPVSDFEETMNNITEENMERFYLRIFGDKKTYLINDKRVPKRTIKSLQDEFRWLYNRIMEPNESAFKWTYAVTSKKDSVFPFKNQMSYWEKATETKHRVVSMPHYFFHNWASFTEFIEFTEKFDPKQDKPVKKAKYP